MMGIAAGAILMLFLLHIDYRMLAKPQISTTLLLVSIVLFANKGLKAGKK